MNPMEKDVILRAIAEAMMTGGLQQMAAPPKQFPQYAIPTPDQLPRMGLESPQSFLPPPPGAFGRVQDDDWENKVPDFLDRANEARRKGQTPW